MDWPFSSKATILLWDCQDCQTESNSNSPELHLRFSFRISGPLNYQVTTFKDSDMFTMFSPIRSLSFSDSDSSAVSQIRQGAGKGLINYNWCCKRILTVKGQNIMLHFIEESWERIMIYGAKQTVNSSKYYCKYVVCICIGMCV